MIKIPLRCKIVDADQGIGVTELAGKFDDTYATQNDFANDAVSSVPSSGSSYSLNLWVL